MRRFNLIFPLALMLVWPTLAIGQDNSTEKEIVIIEKTIDEKGNVISQNTKRLKGKYTEEELQNIIEENNAPNIRSYDLEGLGFEENLNDLFRSRQQPPTIGINLDFANGQAKVDKVYEQSGAYHADIREEDVLVSIDRIPISTIEDVKEVLSTKSSGDLIELLIFRDGQELEKSVELSNTGNRSFSFDFPEGSGFRTFGGEGFDISMDIDSIFNELFESGSFFDGFREMRESPDSDRDDLLNKNKKTEKASLGVFIDNVGTRVVIDEVIPDSAADKYGLRKDDVILSVDSNMVTSFMEVSAYMNHKNIGDSVILEIERDGSVLTKDIVLE